jgi:hypothetical protein
MSLANVYILAAFRALAILLSLARGQRIPMERHATRPVCRRETLDDHPGVGGLRPAAHPGVYLVAAATG